ncbi:MAG: ATP-binding cassette domain-containing protein [Actinomycetaceae bacterium]|nr:ATP-binding cassette domain-containing protein [Actinomycetaceae bacterium]
MSKKLETMASSNVVLKAENLRYFNKGLKHHLSFEIHAGETIAILGASGTGKTTLLNTLAGLSASDGMLILAGQYLNDLAPKTAAALRAKHFSFLKANPPAPLARKVKTAVTETATALKQTPPAYFSQIIADLQLEPLWEHPLTELTDSAKQTVALASALGKKSKILFADNPTRRMTPDDTELAMHTLRKVAKTHQLAVVYSTSDPALAALADRVLVIRNGEIIVELANSNDPQQLAVFTSYLAELAYPPLQADIPTKDLADAEGMAADAKFTDAEEAPAETGQFPIILPLPNRPAEPDLDFDEDDAQIPEDDAQNLFSPPAEITLVHPPSETDTEEIDLTILGEAPAPLPGESLEETLQRLAPTRSFDPDSAHLLDEAQRILNSLPGAVAPQPNWPVNRGNEDA